MRLMFKLMVFAVILSFWGSSKLFAVDANLKITLEPISCTVDNIDIGLAKLTYLTPENCSNYYELFPVTNPKEPVEDDAVNTNPPKNPQFTVTRKQPIASTPTDNTPLYDQIKEDTLSSLVVITFGIILIRSLIVFYDNKNSK